MEKAKAASLARKLMAEHGYGHLAFKFNRRKGALGLCFIKAPGTEVAEAIRIELSEVWIPYLSEAEVKDTILHEIAHAMTPGEVQPHGFRWRRMAAKIGANPYRTAEMVPMEVQRRVQQETAKYVVLCPTHGTLGYINRYGKTYRNGSRRCRKCGQRVTVAYNRHSH